MAQSWYQQDYLQTKIFTTMETRSQNIDITILCAYYCHQTTHRATSMRNSNMATGSWLNYLTRVSRSHFKIFIGRNRPAKPQHVRKFTSLTNETEKSDKVLKKCVFYFGICIGFGCSTGFQLFDWLSNKSFQLRCYNFIVHAKTDTSKSKQFNFVADVVEMTGPAVVHIEDKCQHDNFLDHMMSSSFGSGFLVSEDGLVVTNAHVVQNMKNITVTRSDGSSMVGDITSIDRAADLACVQIRNPNKVRFWREMSLNLSNRTCPIEIKIIFFL